MKFNIIVSLFIVSSATFVISAALMQPSAESLELIQAVRAGSGVEGAKARAENLQRIQDLIAIQGIDLNAQDPQDQYVTPLIVAASISRPDLVEILVNAGADVNKKDRRGNNAFMYAARNGHQQTVQKLLQLGADVAQTNAEGLTASDIAIERQHDNIAQLLSQENKEKLAQMQKA